MADGYQDLIVTMKRVGGVLKQVGIPFALAGGFAAYARGGVSSDHDVDFLLRERDVETALKALAEAGFRIERPPEDWLVKVYDCDRPAGDAAPSQESATSNLTVEAAPGQETGKGNCQETGRGNMVDLIYRPVERPVDDELLTDTDPISVSAIQLPVISATVLMEHKLLSFGQHYCDFAKALPLARSLREQIDWPRVGKATAGSPYARAFFVLLDGLDVIALADCDQPAEVAGVAGVAGDDKGAD
jgi:hypothetical protein